MVNMSRLISSIIQQNGLYNITLPFTKDGALNPKGSGTENAPTEIVLQNIIKTTTIPTYSQFVPWIKEWMCRTRDLQEVDRRMSIYILPSYLTTTEVMYVMAVMIPGQSARGVYGDIASSYGVTTGALGIGLSTGETIATGRAFQLMSAASRIEPTFKYLGENKIRLFGYPPGPLEFRVACEHQENGETIPSGCYESFSELANLDVQQFLYSNLKYFDNIPTASGTINLRLDEWANARAERKEWTNKYEDTFHLDQPDLIHFG